MREKDYKEGFTIIEVALVLAIAGLIFLMAFIAVPAVQRTQRDAKRRDDVGTLLTAIQKYQNNNRKALPDGTGEVTWDTASAVSEADNSWASFYKSFLGSNFEDPMGSHYKLNVVNCGQTGIGAECSSDANYVNKDDTTFDNANYTMYIVKSASCDGSTAVGSGNPKKVAVLYKMEGAGAYCANMQ